MAKKIEQKVVRKAGTLIDRTLLQGGKRLAAAAGMGVGSTTAAIIAAAIVGYGLGKEAFYPEASIDAREGAALRNLHQARAAAEHQLGRPLTKSEYAPIYQAYLNQIVRLRANDPTTYLRPGAE